LDERKGFERKVNEHDLMWLVYESDFKFIASSVPLFLSSPSVSTGKLNCEISPEDIKKKKYCVSFHIQYFTCHLIFLYIGEANMSALVPETFLDVTSRAT